MGISGYGDICFGDICYGDICQFLRDTCLFTSRDMGYLVPPYTIKTQQCIPANTWMSARNLPKSK